MTYFSTIVLKIMLEKEKDAEKKKVIMKMIDIIIKGK
tara:strand:+ start:142 stop:252 length:111 start_codon:yes stop_codon:yes gene_type:complete